MNGLCFRRVNLPRPAGLIEARLMLLSLLMAMGEARTCEGQAVRLQGGLLHPELQLSSISVTATPSTVSFNLVRLGSAAGSQPIAVTTSYFLGVASTVHLYGSFSSTAALSSGVNSIPSSAVTGLCSTGLLTTATPFTQTTPLGAGSGVQIFLQSALLAVAVNRTDALTLNINLAGMPQLPAGHYAGTLTLQAEAF